MSNKIHMKHQNEKKKKKKSVLSVTFSDDRDIGTQQAGLSISETCWSPEIFIHSKVQSLYSVSDSSVGGNADENNHHIDLKQFI